MKKETCICGKESEKNKIACVDCNKSLETFRRQNLQPKQLTIRRLKELLDEYDEDLKLSFELEKGTEYHDIEFIEAEEFLVSKGFIYLGFKEKRDEDK